MCLAGVAYQIQIVVYRCLCHGGEIDVASQIHQARPKERIVYHVVTVMADECAHAALGMIILGFVKAIINHDDGPARQFLRQSGNEGGLV